MELNFWNYLKNLNHRKKKKNWQLNISNYFNNCYHHYILFVIFYNIINYFVIILIFLIFSKLIFYLISIIIFIYLFSYLRIRFANSKKRKKKKEGIIHSNHQSVLYKEK